ncbi:jg613, partial [Pararge aegeria aegeria]
FDSVFVNAGAEWTNKVFGGLNIPAVRVAYVHGSVDPWHALGMTTTQDNDAPAIFIE